MRSFAVSTRCLACRTIGGRRRPPCSPPRQTRRSVTTSPPLLVTNWPRRPVGVGPALVRPAVFDASVLISVEAHRLAETTDWLPVVTVVTVAELALGVRLGLSVEARATRSVSLRNGMKGRVVPIDAELIVNAWVDLRVGLKRALKVNDSWIAATALALDVALLTCDADFDAAAGMIEVVRM